MKNLIATILLCAAAVNLAAAQDTPKIQLDKTVHDFGKTSEVESVKGTFTYSNAGTAPLKLDKPTVSCGCTLVDMKPDLLQPGEKGELSFTLNLGRNRANLVKHITINSNDPENPKIPLTIKAQHVPLYELKPTMARVQVRQGESTNLTVSLARTDGQELKISKIETSKPWITSQIQKPGAETANITLQIAPDGAPRPLAESVRIFGENPDSPVASLFISGRVVGDIVVSPETLLWNVSNPEALKQPGAQALAPRRLAIVSSIPGKTFQLRNVASSIEEMTVEVVSKATGYDIVAKLAGVPKETVRGTITLESDLPSQPTITVPVTVNVAKPKVQASR